MINVDNMSLLVVDDMKSMRLTLRNMLKELGIGGNLMFAVDGKHGLDILKRTQCDLAIVDWNMPVINGIEMLEKIRNDQKLRDMPVIMVTAEAERDIVAGVAETQVEGYLLKPLTLASLDEKIRTVVEKVNNPHPATVHRLKARELEEAGQYEAAIEHVRLALTHKPSASRLLRRMGLLHFKIKKDHIAEKCLLKAVSVNKQDAISRVHLADYYLSKNELEKAGQYYLEVMTLTNQYIDTAFELAKKLLENGYRKLSLNLFSKYIVRSKKQNSAREKVIDFCFDNDEFEYALSLLDYSVRENPSNYEMIYKIGLIHLQTGDREKALKCFMEVDRQAKGHIEAKFQIAKIHYKNQKVFMADDYLNQILRIDPKNEDALAFRREI